MFATAAEIRARFSGVEPSVLAAQETERQNEERGHQMLTEILNMVTDDP